MTASEAEFAADLSAVQADDALLDALGGSDPKITGGLGDLELNALLLAWRRDIDSEPLAELVDLDTAMTIVKEATLAHKRGQRGRRQRVLIPVAAAAAVLAIAFSGTSVAARHAQPGDTLWGLTKVLYGDHARSVEAAAEAKSDLEKANIAIADNRLDDARKALNDAQRALNQVATEDDLSQLMEQHRQLSAQLQNPNPTTGQLPASPEQQSSQPQVQPLPAPTVSSPPSAGTGGTSTPPSTVTSVPVETSTPASTPSSAPPVTGNDPGSPRYDPSGPTPATPSAHP
jgi:hypothetical protein